MFVSSFRGSEGGACFLLKVVRGAVKWVWHPLLVGSFQVTLLVLMRHDATVSKHSKTNKTECVRVCESVRVCV